MLRLKGARRSPPTYPLICHRLAQGLKYFVIISNDLASCVRSLWYLILDNVTVADAYLQKDIEAVKT